MPAEMRIGYVSALQCLMESESEYPDVDGAKTAFDDFAVLHYNLTPFVHNSVSGLDCHLSAGACGNLGHANNPVSHVGYLPYLPQVLHPHPGRAA